MPNQNNNEEWNQNIVNSQDMVCFSSGDASYCIPKRLVSFIEKKAEITAKRWNRLRRNSVKKRKLKNKQKTAR